MPKDFIPMSPRTPWRLFFQPRIIGINGKSKLILAEAVHFRRRGRWYYQNTDGREIPAKLRPVDKENCSNGREHMSIVPRKSRSRSGPTG